MLLQTNSYIVPKERRAEHARLLRRFRQILQRLGCEQFEVFEQMGANWSTGEATGRFVQIMRFRDRKHQRSVHAAEQTDPAAQQLIAEFCEIVNVPYQQQQGLLAIGYYQGVIEAKFADKGQESAAIEAPNPAPSGFGFGGPTHGAPAPGLVEAESLSDESLGDEPEPSDLPPHGESFAAADGNEGETDASAAFPGAAETLGVAEDFEPLDELSADEDESHLPIAEAQPEEAAADTEAGGEFGAPEALAGEDELLAPLDEDLAEEHAVAEPAVAEADHGELPAAAGESELLALDDFDVLEELTPIAPPPLPGAHDAVSAAAASSASTLLPSLSGEASDGSDFLGFDDLGLADTGEAQAAVAESDHELVAPLPDEVAASESSELLTPEPIDEAAEASAAPAGEEDAFDLDSLLSDWGTTPGEAAEASEGSTAEGHNPVEETPTQDLLFPTAGEPTAAAEPMEFAHDFEEPLSAEGELAEGLTFESEAPALEAISPEALPAESASATNPPPLEALSPTADPEALEPIDLDAFGEPAEEKTAEADLPVLQPMDEVGGQETAPEWAIPTNNLEAEPAVAEATPEEETTPLETASVEESSLEDFTFDDEALSLRPAATPPPLPLESGMAEVVPSADLEFLDDDDSQSAGEPHSIAASHLGGMEAPKPEVAASHDSHLTEAHLSGLGDAAFLGHEAEGSTPPAPYTADQDENELTASPLLTHLSADEGDIEILFERLPEMGAASLTDGIAMGNGHANGDEMDKAFHEALGESHHSA